MSHIWPSTVFLLFSLVYVWDGIAHYVRASYRALVPGTGRSGARPVPATAATVADGCLPAEPAVPA